MRLFRRRPAPEPVDADRPARAAALYRAFVREGALVFDVGANLGDRTAVFVELGARVVAVEPQAACAAALRERFHGRVEVVEAAAGATEGEADLLVASAHTISSLNPTWVRRVRESGRFREYRWEETVRVPTTTLDALIARHGAPDFVKVDVEGSELEVLRGLTQPVRALSFEFDFELLEQRLACVDRLAGLGLTDFNFSRGETLELAFADWVDAPAITEFLRATPRDVLFFGDVYARQ